MSEDDTHFSHEDQLKQGYVFDPDSYKSSEHFAVQFGFRSIAPGRDPRIMARGTPGRETGSTAKILNKINVLLRVHLLGLRCPSFQKAEK